MRGSNGASMPATPTVSRCPFRSSDRPPPEPRLRATTLGRSSPTSSTSRPRASHHSATAAAARRSPAPPGTSAGFTESIATRRAASSTMSFAIARWYAAGSWRPHRHDPSRCYFAFARATARSSCALFIDERPSIFSRVACRYSCSRVRFGAVRRVAELLLFFAVDDAVLDRDDEVFERDDDDFARDDERPELRRSRDVGSELGSSPR